MVLLSEEFNIIWTALTAFIVTYVAIPSIVKVAKQKHLFDEPGERTVHKASTPTLGGVAIYAGIVIASAVWVDFTALPQLPYFFAALVIIFFIGLKDDILVIAPLTKMGGQLVAAFIIAVVADFRFTSLHGFYGITDIPYWASLLLTFFVIIVITNAFNLIDGIDGLCSGLGIISSAAFGIWFYLVDNYAYAILAFSLSASLLAFFRFNVFSRKQKIFMGDTGSLILGLVISILAIQFNEMNAVYYGQYAVHAAPAVSFGILIIPLFDTLRVMFVRLIVKRSLFGADKNHIHHRLLDLNLSHLTATLIILGVNILIIIFVFFFQQLEILRLMLLLILIGMVLSHLPLLIFEYKEKRKKEENKQDKHSLL